MRMQICCSYDPNVEIVSENKSSSGFPTGGIVGVSVGAAAVVIAILAIMLYRSRKVKDGHHLSQGTFQPEDILPDQLQKLHKLVQSTHKLLPSVPQRTCRNQPRHLR